MPFIVYSATNKANGKVYVGITMQPLAHRMAQHKSQAGKKNRAFANAIAKYGMNGFEWRVLQECESADALNAAEVLWIHQLNSLAHRGHGYNRTIGGAGTAGCPRSQEARDRQSKSMRATNLHRFPDNRQLPMFKGRMNYRHSDETKVKISRSGKGQRRNLKLCDEDMPLLLQLRSVGATHEQLGKAFSVNRATISYALKRLRSAS